MSHSKVWAWFWIALPRSYFPWKPCISYMQNWVLWGILENFESPEMSHSQSCKEIQFSPMSALLSRSSYTFRTILDFWNSLHKALLLQVSHQKTFCALRLCRSSHTMMFVLASFSVYTHKKTRRLSFIQHFYIMLCHNLYILKYAFFVQSSAAFLRNQSRIKQHLEKVNAGAIKAHGVRLEQRQTIHRVRLELESLRILLQRVNKREKLKRDCESSPSQIHLDYEDHFDVHVVPFIPRVWSYVFWNHEFCIPCNIPDFDHTYYKDHE